MTLLHALYSLESLLYATLKSINYPHNMFPRYVEILKFRFHDEMFISPCILSFMFLQICQEKCLRLMHSEKIKAEILGIWSKIGYFMWKSKDLVSHLQQDISYTQNSRKRNYLSAEAMENDNKVKKNFLKTFLTYSHIRLSYYNISHIKYHCAKGYCNSQPRDNSNRYTMSLCLLKIWHYFSFPFINYWKKYFNIILFND